MNMEFEGDRANVCNSSVEWGGHELDCCISALAERGGVHPEESHWSTGCVDVPEEVNIVVVSRKRAVLSA